MGSMVSGNQAGAKHAFGRFMQSIPNGKFRPVKAVENCDPHVDSELRGNSLGGFQVIDKHPLFRGGASL